MKTEPFTLRELKALEQAMVAFMSTEIDLGLDKNSPTAEDYQSALRKVKGRAMTSYTTVGKVNKALARAGLRFEMVKGSGYFWFTNQYPAGDRLYPVEVDSIHEWPKLSGTAERIVEHVQEAVNKFVSEPSPFKDGVMRLGTGHQISGLYKIDGIPVTLERPSALNVPWVYVKDHATRIPGKVWSMQVEGLGHVGFISETLEVEANVGPMFYTLPRQPTMESAMAVIWGCRKSVLREQYPEEPS